MKEQEKASQILKEKKQCLQKIKADFYALFRLEDAHKRGKALEKVLNDLFKMDGILLREAFTIKGDNSEGIIEQIDGVIEISGEVYLVEMKWRNTPLGRSDVSDHLVRVYNRGHVQGVFISYSGYTKPAIDSCRESLQKAVFVLCTLEEIVKVLEAEKDLKEWLKVKVRAAKIDKNPFFNALTD